MRHQLIAHRSQYSLNPAGNYRENRYVDLLLLDNVFLSGCLEIQHAFMSEKAIKALKFKKTIKIVPRTGGNFTDK